MANRLREAKYILISIYNSKATLRIDLRSSSLQQGCIRDSPAQIMYKAKLIASSILAPKGLTRSNHLAPRISQSHHKLYKLYVMLCR